MVVVSYVLGKVRDLCERYLFLDDGRAAALRNADFLMEEYLRMMREDECQGRHGIGDNLPLC